MSEQNSLHRLKFSKQINLITILLDWFGENTNLLRSAMMFTHDRQHTRLCLVFIFCNQRSIWFSKERKVQETHNTNTTTGNKYYSTKTVSSHDNELNSMSSERRLTLIVWYNRPDWVFWMLAKPHRPLCWHANGECTRACELHACI